MTARTFRLHQNGRTLLSWWRADFDWVTLPISNDPRQHFQVRFDSGPAEAPAVIVLLDGALLYQFAEEVSPPPLNGFHKVEFLYDNDLWIIEYRRDAT